MVNCFLKLMKWAELKILKPNREIDSFGKSNDASPRDNIHRSLYKDHLLLSNGHMGTYITVNKYDDRAPPARIANRRKVSKIYDRNGSFLSDEMRK